MPTKPPRCLPPELLELIIEDQSRGTLASCTRVSQMWSDVAIRRLWRHLTSPLPLLELLAPLHAATSGSGVAKITTSVFKACELASADWRRFEGYARRVLTLTYNDLDNIKGGENSYIDTSAFVMIHCYRPYPSSLLPNLTSLSWSFSRPWDNRAAPSIIPFLSPAIISLQITISTPFHTGLAEEISAIWRTLLNRTPSVTSIHIRMDSEGSDAWDTDGSKWVASCQRLESIILPRHWDSAPIVEGLKSLPELRCIQLDRSRDCYHWFENDRTSFLPRWLQEETFRNLQFASFDAPLANIFEALRASTKFGRLKGLSFGYEYGPLTLLPEILTLVVGQCSFLESISLDFTSHMDDDWVDAVDFDAFQPLLSCHSLSHVEIRHDRPIDLDESDIEHMGKSWPRLTYLRLEALWGAIYDGETPLMGIPLDHLAFFANSFPNLEFLGIHFVPHPPATQDLQPSTTFPLLVTLSVGTSTVPGPFNQVAAFLARLFLHRDLKIVCNEYRLETDDIQAWSRVEELFQSSKV